MAQIVQESELESGICSEKLGEVFKWKSVLNFHQKGTWKESVKSIFVDPVISHP